MVLWNREPKRKEQEDPPEKINLNQLLIAFVILGGGLGLSVIGFSIELVTVKFFEINIK